MPSRLPLTTDDYIAASLKELRADLKKRTVFSRAGRVVVHSDGERRLLAPNGEPIKITEIAGPDGSGGNQIETKESLHANIRPRPLLLKLQVRG